MTKHRMEPNGMELNGTGLGEVECHGMEGRTLAGLMRRSSEVGG
jgi:hypothetical protein